MSLTFSDLQTDVKARALLSESGTTFDTQIKNAINASLYRVSREAFWRNLRRKTTFDTVAEYTEGTGAVTATEDSTAVTITGATLLTDGVYIGRLITIGSGGKPYTIETITGETTLTLDRVFDGTTTTTGAYKIYGQEEYNVNIQAGRIALIWHEDYGYPLPLQYITDIDFYSFNRSRLEGNTPTTYRQWGFDSVTNQPREASAIAFASSSTADQNIDVTIYGVVSGFPDQETVATNSSNGTTSVTTTKEFTTVERIVKAASTAGRITLTANSANTTVGTLVAGDGSGMTEYLKIQLFPYPNRVFPVNVAYYKDPYRLVNDGDIQELGHEFDEAILLLAIAKVNFAQSKKNADKYFNMYSDEIKSLRQKNKDTIANWLPNLKRVSHGSRGLSGMPNKYLSYSQLGGFYGPMVY